MLRCHQCFCPFKKVEDLQRHLAVHGWIHEQADYASASLKPALGVVAMAERNTKNHRSSISRKMLENKKLETLLLNEVEYEYLMGLSDYLDYTNTGNDYKKLARLFSIPKDEVEQLALSHLRGVRPTEQLIRLLNMQCPEMTMKTFMKKCEEMKRLDVVTYIRENIFKCNL